MKLHVGKQKVMIFEDVFNPIVIRTEKGDFAICERDGILEVSKDGKILLPPQSPEKERLERVCAELRLLDEERAAGIIT